LGDVLAFRGDRFFQTERLTTQVRTDIKQKNSNTLTSLRACTPKVLLPFLPNDAEPFVDEEAAQCTIRSLPQPPQASTLITNTKCTSGSTPVPLSKSRLYETCLKNSSLCFPIT